MVNTYEYDAYGQRTSTTVSVYNPFGYTGEYTDAESGLVYLRARYFDPSTQQFLTVDPLLASTEEAYAYVGGNPLSFTDPFGLAWSIAEKAASDTIAVPAVPASILGGGAALAQNLQEDYDLSIDLIQGAVFIGGIKFGGPGGQSGPPAKDIDNATSQLQQQYQAKWGANKGICALGPYFKGTAKPLTRGATPNSTYTQFKNGNPVQTAIYDANGNVIIHIDWKKSGSEPPGHYHIFPQPGDPSTGHGKGAMHYPPREPSEWGLPTGWDTP